MSSAGPDRARGPLYVVRHAPVDAAGLCYGRGDVPTLVTPDEAARAIVEALEGLGGLRPTTVWSSWAERCRAPAALVARSLGVRHQADDRVAELDVGQWEGRRWEEIELRDGARLARWMSSWQTEAPPGGERPDELLARVAAWQQSLGPEPALLVAHAGVVRALRVLAGESWEHAMRAAVPHLTLTLAPGTHP